MTNGFINLRHLRPHILQDLPHATHFTLECSCEGAVDFVLTSIETAEDEGGFGLHIKAPERPTHYYAMGFATFVESLDALVALRRTHPDATMTLACEETTMEIEGDDIWRGAISARAAATADDLDDPWIQFAAAVAESDMSGHPIQVDPYAHQVLIDIAARL